jgi:hypothetical protein
MRKDDLEDNNSFLNRRFKKRRGPSDARLWLRWLTALTTLLTALTAFLAELRHWPPFG